MERRVPRDDDAENGSNRSESGDGMRIYLTGFMGAGKSTIGRRLAKRLGTPFVDLDAAIEADTGVSIEEIFETRGEPSFRRLEAAALEQTRPFRDVVVATGGGTFAREDNVRFIREHGLSVWIAPPLEILFERIERPGRKHRPMYRGRDLASELYQSRIESYGMADLRLDVSGLEHPREVVDRIVGWLEERQCDT